MSTGAEHQVEECEGGEKELIAAAQLSPVLHRRRCSGTGVGFGIWDRFHKMTMTYRRVFIQRAKAKWAAVS
jgi:hypothetical protein